MFRAPATGGGADVEHGNGDGGGRRIIAKGAKIVVEKGIGPDAGDRGKAEPQGFGQLRSG